MIVLTKLQDFLDDYLHFDKKVNISKVDPFMANGLMVKGKEEVGRIGFGVSASVALFEKAKQQGCDALIVHHAFNLPPFNHYDRIFQNRIGYLIKNEISLFGYHFLLDAHPEIGNNVQILKAIGAKPIEPFLHHGQPWGWIGEIEQGKSFEDIKGLFKSSLSPRTVTYNFGPKIIKRIVAISGKGAPGASEMTDLINNKVDLYITGETHEWNRELFREAKINFIAGGHYHTECFGIKALMKYVETNLPEVESEFLELENEI
jgi:dinuclear metal center YbgI/SA1388 family protein